ncbi:ankyrin repeat-containing domain protein [Lactarius vividus]|nr:ankyrin repeat-containing domain protein [Lactarius vividus]
MDGSVQDMYDTILLHSAAYHGRPEMARILSDCGVKSNAKNYWGETALHVVSRGRYQSQDGVRVAKLFLERGVDVNAQDKDHNSPLHSASYNGNLEIARVLLEYGAKASAKNDRGETPLHHVSQGEYESQANGVGIAQLLLDHGMDVNTRDENGVTPLRVASWCGKLEIVRLFLEQCTLKNDRDRTLLQVGPKGEYYSKNITSVLLTFSEDTVDSNVQQKDHETALHIACFRGKPEIVRLLLDHGTEVTAKNSQGEIPLHLVSRGEYNSPSDGVRVAELLLERGTDVNARDEADWTPLHSASYCGKSEIVQTLIHHGARLDVENNLTPLHVASYNGKLEIVRLLLDHGAKVDTVDEYGKTPLHDVSRGKYDSEEAGVGIVRLLLERGGNVNEKSKQQYTPLHFASYNGKLEIVRLLLDHGGIVDAVDEFGITPLHDVARGKYDSEEAGVGVTRLLLEHGGDANGQSKQQYTPLHFASYNGKPEIVRLLLDHGAKVDTVDVYGKTPLHDISGGKYSSEEAGVGVTWLLLERGGDVNAQSKRHQTPLHVSLSGGKLEVTRLLLDQGAKVDDVDEFGNTPLHYVSGGKYESEEVGVGVARLLLERGGDVNRQNKQQCTPLHLASFNGRLEIARVLLDHNSKVDAVDEFGITPLCNVSRGKYDSEEAGVGIVRLLLERGGDVNERSKQQYTPLHFASYNGKLEVVRLLLDHGGNVDAVDDFGKTPLHHVAQGKYDSEEAGVSVARLLLERGADTNAQAKQHRQRTPLHFASFNGKLEIARLLLDHGAKVDAVDELGNTPLHDVSKGKYESETAVAVARLLLERGSDVNSQPKYWQQRTPLHIASYNGKVEIVRLLLEQVANVDAVSDFGGTALHYVSGGKHESEEAGVGIAQLLLEYGGDVNGQSKQRWTPLHFASFNGKLEIARLLLDRGAKVDAMDEFGETPLCYVPQGKYEFEEIGIDITRLLLEHGADVNPKTRSGKTPLDLVPNRRPMLAQFLRKEVRKHGRARVRFFTGTSSNR